MATTGASGAKGGSNDPGTWGKDASDWIAVPWAQCSAHMRRLACAIDMSPMQVGCDADVTVVGMETMQALAANAACWHSHNSASTPHKMWWRRIRRRWEMPIMSLSLSWVGWSTLDRDQLQRSFHASWATSHAHRKSSRCRRPAGRQRHRVARHFKPRSEPAPHSQQDLSMLHSHAIHTVHVPHDIHVGRSFAGFPDISMIRSCDMRMWQYGPDTARCRTSRK
jgi:hypothetical protein